MGCVFVGDYLYGPLFFIESIFIDEGFGTLDSDTLETALAALENLQARGKTVG